MAGSLKLSFIIEAIDRATAPLRRVNERIAKVTEPIGKVRASFNSLLRESHLPRLAGQARLISQRFDGVTGALRGIAGAALIAGGALAAVVIPLNRTLDEAGRINDLAAMAGVGAREFQRLAFAFKLDGVNAELAAKGITDLTRRAAEAVSGNEEMAKWFTRAGISAEFLRKNLGEPAVLLDALADGVAKLATSGQRGAVMNALMSESGVKLVQTFARGSEEIRRLGDEAESLGEVLDDKTIGAMDEAGDSVSKMLSALNGIMKAVTVAALPAIERITSRVIDWSKANRALIATRVTQFVERLIQNLPQIAETTGRVLGALGKLIVFCDRVVSALGGIETIVAVVAGLLIGKLLVAVVSLGSAIVGLTPIIASLGAVLLATPIGWFLAGVAAIAGAAYLVYKNWEPIKQFFIDLWEGVRSAILKLDAITPDWVKRFTLPGMALSAAANAVRPDASPSALAAAGSTDVGGTLRIVIDQDGRARVAALEKNNPNVDFDVDAGPMFISP